MTKDQFKSYLAATIKAKYVEVLAEKKHVADKDVAILTDADALSITNYVRGVFKARLDVVPENVEAACKFSEVLVAPSTVAKIKLLKAAIGLSGGVGGIAILIAAIGPALGWGATTVTTVHTILVKVGVWLCIIPAPVSGGFTIPLLVGAAGVLMASLCVYFSLTGTHAQRAEKFRKALENATLKAVDQIWDWAGEGLSKDA